MWGRRSRGGSPIAGFLAVALVVAGCALILGVALRSPKVTRLVAADPIQLARHPDPDAMWFASDGSLVLVTRDAASVRVERCDPLGGACDAARAELTGGTDGAPYAVHAGPEVITVAWAVSLRAPSGDDDESICFVDLHPSDGSTTPSCRAAAGAPIRSLALLDDRRSVVARSGGELEFFDVRGGDASPSGTRLRGDWPLHGTAPFVLASELDSGNFAVLDVRDGPRRQASFYVCPEGSEPTSLGVLPSGEPVVGTTDGSVLYPRGEAWVPLGPLPGAVRRLAVQQGGRVVVAGDFDGVHAVDPGGAPPIPLVDGLRDVASIAAADGHLALSRGGPVTVYRVAERIVAARLAAHPLCWVGLLLIAAAVLPVALVRRVDPAPAPATTSPHPSRDASVPDGRLPSIDPMPDDEFRSVDAPSWIPELGAPERTLTTGTVVGSYEIRALLGSGAMGHVYEAWDRDIRREVAIKILTPRISRDPQALARFRKEAVALGAVTHPNVLGIHHVGEHDGTVYVIMERLYGETLRERLERGSLEPTEVRRIAIEVAKGLAAAHDRGLVHRDIKPDNIFLAERGVKLLDFGLARAFVDETASDRESHPTVTRMTSPGALVGTFGYMSPEQAVGDPIDGRSDLFALGCVMYEMLTGEGPYAREQRHESIAALLRDSAPSIVHRGDPLVSRLGDVISRCLAREVGQRFTDADALIAALRATPG